MIMTDELASYNGIGDGFEGGHYMVEMAPSNTSDMRKTARCSSARTQPNSLR